MKILNFALFALAAAGAYGATTGVTVNSDGALVRPSKAAFAAQNNLVSQEVICIRVDMFGTTTNSFPVKASYWNEVELKVLDKDGNMIYFICSDWCDRSYHANHPELIDNGAKIAYYPFGDGISGVCAHKKVWLRMDGTDDYSWGSCIHMDEWSGYGISAVEIYPNLSGTVGGKSVREIFLNPENTILISRKSTLQYEKHTSGTRIWRAAVVQYYRSMPTAQN